MSPIYVPQLFMYLNIYNTNHTNHKLTIFPMLLVTVTHISIGPNTLTVLLEHIDLSHSRSQLQYKDRQLLLNIFSALHYLIFKPSYLAICSCQLSLPFCCFLFQTAITPWQNCHIPKLRRSSSHLPCIT